eukprot:TRINITY_DN18421_c5_g1_i1.p1 TRINITY_DN18421_c5_g1~~TRINITY_DN18421_c5_g1_i1.p1  ORF type:complete len:298 (+),score=72.25 TRINITY_DN18421_c5_g1_i1:136-1029(+)
MGDTLTKPVTDKYSQQFENQRYRVGASGMQGWRRGMEDAHTTALSLSPEAPECAFYAVYDGHCGQNIARYCGEHVHRRVVRSPHFVQKEYQQAMVEGFLGTDEDLMASELKNDGSGCTAVACLVTGDGQIICANAGDSRCVLCRGGKAVAMSSDHKPTLESELRRIQKAGSFVTQGRVNGNLALSRAIGDFDFKQNKSIAAEDQAISAKPDVVTKQLQKEDEFVVLACDGIWDVMSNEDVIEFVRKEIAVCQADLALVCEKTFDRCLAPSAPGLGCDNMTMVVVQFKDEFKRQLQLL